MTNFTVTLQRAPGANLATKPYVAMVQPGEVNVTFDELGFYSKGAWLGKSI
jgi:hypothetical protein